MRNIFFIAMITISMMSCNHIAQKATTSKEKPMTTTEKCDPGILWNTDDPIIFHLRELMCLEWDAQEGKPGMNGGTVKDSAYAKLFSEIKKGKWSLGGIQAIYKDIVTYKNPYITDSLQPFLLVTLEKQVKELEQKEVSIESSQFLRGQIVLLRGSFLYEGNSLRYPPDVEVFDKKLMAYENRLVAVYDKWQKKGYRDND